MMDHVQTVFLYGAWALYLLAGVLMAVRLQKAGDKVFLAGAFSAAAAVLSRGIMLSHLPMQSMYEVFVLTGALVWPAAYICARMTQRPGGALDPFLGALILAPALFVFDPTPRLVPPLLRHWLFGPHVLAYLLGYLIMFKSGAAAVKVFFPANNRFVAWRHARDVRALVRFGFPLLTLGLVLGACWGKLAWGAFWNWDPKVMWSMAMWLVYFAVLAMPLDAAGRPPARRTAVTAILGCAVILCTLLWVNLGDVFAGLHSYAG